MKLPFKIRLVGGHVGKTREGVVFKCHEYVLHGFREVDLYFLLQVGQRCVLAALIRHSLRPPSRWGLPVEPRLRVQSPSTLANRP